ncbi:hypothetical protein [Vreelandella sulfidaeris]|uniref:hypothetical protein n=1 Tax=Vreelandella sulfidaeris TaxID=115553 RepID=UPI0035F0522B
MFKYCHSSKVKCAFVMSSLLLLAGCTTYTWPDGSQKTVIGVVPQDENQRYEEEQIEPIRYRVPDEIPETRSE